MCARGFALRHLRAERTHTEEESRCATLRRPILQNIEIYSVLHRVYMYDTR